MHAVMLTLGALCCTSSGFVGGAWWASVAGVAKRIDIDKAWIEPRPRERPRLVASAGKRIARARARG